MDAGLVLAQQRKNLNPEARKSQRRKLGEKRILARRFHEDVVRTQKGLEPRIKRI